MLSDLFPLKYTKNVIVDENHTYCYGKTVAVQDSVTKILNRGRNFNSEYMKKSANFGTRFHDILHRIIGQDSISKYSDDELEIVMNMINRFPQTIHLYNGEPAIFSWEDKLIGGTPDVINTHCIIEVKTTTKSSKIHEKQLVWYMEMYMKPKGYLVYADPTIPTICHVRGSDEYNHLIKCILQDLRLYYEKPVELAPGCTTDEISSLINEIDFLKENLKILEEKKDNIINKILADKAISEQIEMGHKANLNGFYLQKVFTKRKEIDIEALSQAGLYLKFVKIKESSYVKLMRDENDNR